MRYLKLTIAYDGARYCGWQAQVSHPTIQARLEKALQEVTGESTRATGSGRTDAGVHAYAQVVSWATNSLLPPNIMLRALNANLPDDIVVLRVEEAKVGFNAIRDAVRKRYRYVVQDGRIRDVFALHHAWFVPRPLNDAAMCEAAQALIGRHDFSSFEASGSPRQHSVRTVFDLELSRHSANGFTRLFIEVEADGFLYNMVRNIVGTLVEVGKGNREPSWVREVLESRDRRLAGRTAPAQGLFLMHVTYENELKQQADQVTGCGLAKDAGEG